MFGALLPGFQLQVGVGCSSAIEHSLSKLKGQPLWGLQAAAVFSLAGIPRAYTVNMSVKLSLHRDKGVTAGTLVKEGKKLEQGSKG